MTSAVSAPPWPRRPFGTRIVLTLLALVAIAGIAWWSIPALSPPAFSPAPALNENRLRELKANRVFTSRIVGLDVRRTSGDSQARLIGGYMDSEQIVFFMRLDPPARTLPASTGLRDQFGRSHAVRGQFADLATGESILYFHAPAFPLLQTGARFTLEVSELERMGAQRVPVSLSMTATVVANDPTVGAYLVDMAINYLVLAVVGGAYLSLTVAALRLLRVPTVLGRAYLRGVSSAVFFVVIALPTYIAIGTLFRHDPVGPGGLQRQLEAYLPAAVATFYLLQFVAVVIGVVRSDVARMRACTAVASGVGVLSFLVLIQPLAEFANACYIGIGFLIRPSC